MKENRENLYMKLRIEQHGTIHYVATCDNGDCDWQACIFTDETPNEESVRRATRKHIRETGHAVCIESGKSTTYSPS